MEAVIIVDVLRRAGTKLVADTSISSYSDQIFDLVTLPGGMPGSVRLRDCEVLQKITRSQAEERRLYGAICAAPAVTLLPWGLLRRKQTTSHPAFFDKLPTFWAVKSNIQVSGALTTSRGPGTCFVFALCLVEQLYGETVAKELGELLEVSFPYFWQDPYRELKLVGPADDESRKEEFNNVEWSFDRIPRVLIPVANGSEEIEVVTIVDILRQAKVDITVASVEKSVQILASQGTNIIADKLLGVAADSTYDLIILPGGDAGTERLSKSRILKRLLKEQGLPKGKKATAHPSMANKPTNELVNNTRVDIDGKLITSRGLATVAEFALAIVSKLYGHARARSVAEGLVYEYPRTWAEKVLACNILSVLIHDKYIWSAKLTLPLEKVHIIWLGNWLHKRADSSSIVIAENYMPIDVYSSAISQQLNISVAKVTLPLVYVKEGTVEMEMSIGFVAEF